MRLKPSVLKRSRQKSDRLFSWTFVPTATIHSFVRSLIHSLENHGLQAVGPLRPVILLYFLLSNDTVGQPIHGLQQSVMSSDNLLAGLPRGQSPSTTP